MLLNGFCRSSSHHHHLIKKSTASISTKTITSSINKQLKAPQVNHHHHHYFTTNRSTDFGYDTIDANNKDNKVKDIFTKVADKYDIMNDFMSFGIHRLWKDEYVQMMNLSLYAHKSHQQLPRHLDVAGGTGDIGFRSLKQLINLYPNYSQLINNFNNNSSTISSSGGVMKDEDKNVVIFDINPDMLKVGRRRAIEQFSEKERDLLGFIEGSAEELPFADGSFDFYTIAFGLRNVTNKDKAISEAFRVLKKGGKMMILEFSHVRDPMLREIYNQFSFNVIPRMGEVVANDAASYQYLVESIRRFPKQEELAQMITKEGFVFTSFVNFTFGVVAVHSAFKP